MKSTSKNDEETWTPVHPNRVRQHRLALGLTQKQLAEKLNTSQQQVQRVEAGQIVRLDMALALCGILKQDLAEIFPKAAKLMKMLQRENQKEDDAELLSKAGVDADCHQWTVIFETTLGHKGYLRMSSEDTQRFRNCLFNEIGTGSTFFVADHQGLTFALNLRQVRYANVCFDFGQVSGEKDMPIFPDLVEKPEGEEILGGIAVFMKDRQKPLFFHAEPDVSREEGELNQIMYRMDSYDQPDTEELFVSFTDGDGEDVFLRIEDIVLLAISKDLLDPELFDATLEREEENK